MVLVPLAQSFGTCSAMHRAATPVFVPVQLQVHGPVPVTGDTLPASHSLPVGAVVRIRPFNLPHMASVPASGAAAAPARGGGRLRRNHTNMAGRAAIRPCDMSFPYLPMTKAITVPWFQSGDGFDRRD